MLERREAEPMGREAVCLCRWGESSGRVTALLESRELILRGDVRKRVPIAAMSEIRVDEEAGALSFVCGGETVALMLGPEFARKWEGLLRKPPPTLAKRLGITAETRVWVMGKIDDEGLAETLKAAKKGSAGAGDLIVARVGTVSELDGMLEKTAGARGRGVPVWVVYRKGRGHALDETAVRTALRGCGMVDTKVTAVSEELTALRFNRRKDPAD